MKLRIIIHLFLCFVLLMNSARVFAFETDQYNLPPEPLADIGDEVSEYTQRNIKEAIDKINDEILAIENCSAQKNENCKNSSKLAYLRSEDAVARAVFKQLGDGIIPFTKSGSWMESHEFAAQPARYTTGYRESIFLTAPFDYLTISSTVNLYGTDFGTDKIAHIFQQGYDYYKIYKRGLKKGLSEDEAVNKAVKWGRKTESTYFGTWVSGVYSNADLYSNYAGFKFYLGLTKEILIENKVRPAVLQLENGIWTFNENIDGREILLKPFISKHLNEAYNPNKYFNILGFRDYIRRVVRKQSCPQWFARYPNLSRKELEKTTEALEVWNGENYGFSASDKFVTIANTCFDEQKTADADSD